jgi:uncharacterized protein (TIGR03437 family)
MTSVPVFAALLFAAPLFPAAGGGTTAIDSAGNVWRTGQNIFVATTATAFQKTAVSTVCGTEDLSPFQPLHVVYCTHAYLIEQDPSGNVLYATYLGGSSQDAGTAVTTDAHGNVYITGYTYSADFPVTPGVVQARNAGPLTPRVVTALGAPYGPTSVVPGGDVFVAKFTSDGALLFSTLLGGSGSDVPSLIAADASGSVYVSGTTASPDFPLTTGAITHQPAASFFARLNPTGTVLTYSTYSAPSILAFDVDNQGRAYLTGDSSQPPSPVTGGAYVTIVDTSAGNTLSSTYLPSFAPKISGAGVAIAVNAASNLFLALSPAPLPPSPVVSTPPFRQLGASYFLQLSADGGRILTETDIGQTQFDSLLLDASGNAYAFGHGTGAIPATAIQPLAAPCSADGGSFVLESNPAGGTVAATYFRQGDDTAVSLTSPGHILLYRTQSSTTLPIDLTLQPAATFGCPANLASNVASLGLAPGEIFVLAGSGLGPAQGVSAVPTGGQYPTSLGGVQVMVNSRPAPLLFVGANEIHAVAPFYLQAVFTVQVQYGGQSALLDVSLAGVNPGIFTVNGQAAILNQDGTVNTPANPAALGSVVSIYATGTGSLKTPLADGQVTPLPPPYILTGLVNPQVTFDGVAGKTLWSGSAPGLVAGVTQINVQLPAALPPGALLGATSVVLDAAGIFSPPVLMSVKQ